MAEARLGRWLALAACGGAAVLVVAAAGLLPAREPAPPEREPFSVQKTLPPPSLLTPAPLDAGAPEAAAPRGQAETRTRIPSVVLCEAPERGVRWYKVALFPGQTTLLVWCKQGYELFGVRLSDAAADARGARLPEVTRLGRFRARGELPGGAVAGDFDADGATDLVLGVAARAGVVHRSGAGVYWVRGRAQGGFEPARALAETSSAALAAHETPGHGHELVVLTAGDVAAQRPGELWSFARSPALVRQRVVPVALDPRGLALRPATEPGWLEAWVLSGQPGRLDRLQLELATHELRPEQTTSLALRGAQALAHEPSDQAALLARDATSIRRIERGPPPQLAPFAEGVHVGPFAVSDLDGDLQLDVFAALEDGVAWLSGRAEVVERTLPPELKVQDVETARVAGLAVPLPLVLVQGPGAQTLSLLVVPSPPWAEAAGLELAPLALKEAEAQVSVALD